jgi:hypothetical protein
MSTTYKVTNKDIQELNGSFEIQLVDTEFYKLSKPTNDYVTDRYIRTTNTKVIEGFPQTIDTTTQYSLMNDSYYISGNYNITGPLQIKMYEFATSMRVGEARMSVPYIYYIPKEVWDKHYGILIKDDGDVNIDTDKVSKIQQLNDFTKRSYNFLMGKTGTKNGRGGGENVAPNVLRNVQESTEENPTDESKIHLFQLWNKCI